MKWLQMKPTWTWTRQQLKQPDPKFKRKKRNRVWTGQTNRSKEERNYSTTEVHSKIEICNKISALTISSSFFSSLNSCNHFNRVPASSRASHWFRLRFSQWKRHTERCRRVYLIAFIVNDESFRRFCFHRMVYSLCYCFVSAITNACTVMTAKHWREGNPTVSTIRFPNATTEVTRSGGWRCRRNHKACTNARHAASVNGKYPPKVGSFIESNWSRLKSGWKRGKF